LKEKIQYCYEWQEDDHKDKGGLLEVAAAADHHDHDEEDAHQRHRERGVGEPQGKHEDPGNEPQRKKAVHNVSTRTVWAVANKSALQICATTLEAKVDAAREAHHMRTARFELDGLAAAWTRFCDALHFRHRRIL